MKKLILLLVCLIGLACAPVSAATTAPTSPTLNQTYNASSDVLAGMIVELQPGATDTVEPLVKTDVSKILGVVVPYNDSALVLSTTTTTGAQQVLVATSGRYNMLVSNESGTIKAGDYITGSSIPGIGMKAGSTQVSVVGQAAGTFDGKNNVLGTIPLKSSIGGFVNVNVGSIPVDVRLATNPLLRTGTALDVPNFLAKTANSIADRQVNAVRIYLSILVVFATVIITSSMLYSGVRSDVISVGRNPLARKNLSRSLFQIMFTGLIIFIVGIGAAYAILKL